MHKESRLVGLCAEQATAHPEILSNIRCDDVTEQQVWGAVIGKNASLWNAPNNALGARDTVLAQLVEGLPVDNYLLEVLAKTPLANLCANPERARLWSLLPLSQHDYYLQATATGWLEVAANGGVVISPEAPLERAIVASSNLRSILERSSVPLDARLAIVSGLPSFAEDKFIAWLDSLLKGARKLPHADSEQLGTLVASRHWKAAAKYLSDQLANRPDIKPGLRLCADLLSFYTRWKLGISRPSADEKWKIFEDVVCELYPGGPDSDELWSRAGGKNSDLPGWAQNGATRWHIALNLVRFGGCPTARDLLKVMRHSYPRNERLHLLISDTDIVG